MSMKVRLSITTTCGFLLFILSGWPQQVSTDSSGLICRSVAQPSALPSAGLDELGIRGRWVGGRLRQPQYSLEITDDTVRFSPLSNRIRTRSTPPVVERDQSEASIYQILSIDGPIVTLQPEDPTESPVHMLFWSPQSAFIWQAGDREVGFLSKVSSMPNDLMGEWNCIELSQNRPPSGRYRIVIGQDAFSVELEGRIEVMHPIALRDCGENVELAVVPSRSRPYSVIVHRRDSDMLLWEMAEEGDPDRSTFLFLYRDEPPSWLESYLGNASIGALQRRSAMRDEVTENIRRIFDASVLYYNEGGRDAADRVIRQQFPPSTPRTPSQVPCVATDPDPGLWGADTWMALNFAIWDPYYFSYQYDSSGQGEGASFTVTAYGDFDCDGVYSTFTRTGSVSESGEIQSSELLIFNPDE